MKIDTQSWHYRLMAWAWDEVPRSLCPYVDQLLCAIIVSPFLFAYREIRHVREWLPIVIIFAVAIALNIIIGKWLYFALGVAFGLVVLAVRSIVGNVDWHHEHAPKPKKPGLVKEYLEAKHRKICPLLEFE